MTTQDFFSNFCKMWLEKQNKVQKRPTYIIDIIIFKLSELYIETVV